MLLLSRVSPRPRRLATYLSTLRYLPGSRTLEDWTRHHGLRAWVEQQAALLQPSCVHLCEGSAAERHALLNDLVAAGTLVKLSSLLRPGSFFARSPPSDVSRVESRTFICCERKEDAGPLNNWTAPAEMRATLAAKLSGAMRGRVLFAVPFCMGPLGSPFSTIGVQLTDSRYVVISTRIMTRMGRGALDVLGDKGHFIKCVHSVGAPLAPGQVDEPWPSNADKYITHFPETKEVVSYGSGYGGNAILGTKCVALRIASVLARERGWLAEHMTLSSFTSPTGVKKYVCASFPSACGKTAFAMMMPTLPGWKVELLGDDIAWLRIGADGRLWALNPENGIFGMAPGTGPHTNPVALAACSHDTIFTNVALDPKSMDVWWPGLTENAPSRLSTWLRRDCVPSSSNGNGCADEVAHPNSRFSLPTRNVPTLAPEWESPEGVPIDAIVFGGRRASVVPLVTQSRSWEDGVLMGATLSSEQMAASEGSRGEVRFDPMAMRPFIGYDAGSYLKHWLSFTERTDRAKLPKIFCVNFFRRGAPAHQGAKGPFLWPGFGDNVRLVEWMLRRCAGSDADANAVSTPTGYVPAPGAINVKGLSPATVAAMSELCAVDARELLAEQQRAAAFLASLGPSVPPALRATQAALVARLAVAAGVSGNGSSNGSRARVGGGAGSKRAPGMA